MGIIEMIMPVGYPVSGDYILNKSIIRKISLFCIVRSFKKSLWISQISNLGLSFKYIVKLTSFIICKIFSSVLIKIKTKVVIPIG